MSNEATAVPQAESQQPNLPANTAGAHPAANYRLATDVAGLCKELVVRSAIDIHGRKYVRAEGWQAIATAHGCVASARDVERVENGFRAVGEVRKISDGTVIATAEGFVGDDETMWSRRPEYARRAMAQTRAISRACRSAFAHVVVLMDAGLSTTPAEEVPESGFEEKFSGESGDGHLPKPEGTHGSQLSPQTTGLTSPMAAGTQEWEDVVIHFGKNKGVRLGDLEPRQLRWYQNEWQPRPYNGRISEQDISLRNALDASLDRPEVPADEESEEVLF